MPWNKPRMRKWPHMPFQRFWEPPFLTKEKQRKKRHFEIYFQNQFQCRTPHSKISTVFETLFFDSTNRGKLVRSFYEGFICFYVIFFKIKLCFPIPSTIHYFLSHLYFAHAQLMVNYWHIFSRTCILVQVPQYHPNAFYNLPFQQTTREVRWKIFQLNAQANMKLQQDTITCDKNWQDRFFFKKGD